jgi:Flp pilus assembly protein TadG
MIMNKRAGGQALVELAILAPWIFFLFISVVNTGFCLVAAISVQNAARAAALYISSGSTVPASSAASAACTVVTNQLQGLSNHGFFNGSCSSSGPLQVTASQTTTQATVTVNYQTISLIPFPGFSGTYMIARSATYPTRVN